MILRPALLLACFAASAMAAPAAPTPEKPKQALQVLKQQIDSLQKQVADNETLKHEASDALKDSEKAISEASRLLDELGGQYDEIQGELQRLNNALASLRRQTLDSQERLRKLLLAQYKAGNPDAFKLLLNSQDPNEISRELQYYSYVAQAQAAMIDTLKQQVAELNRTIVEASTRERELARIRAEKKAQQEKLTQERHQREQVLSSVSSEIRQQRTQISRMQSDEKQLSAVIERINKLIEARERDAKRQAERERNRQAKLAARQAGVARIGKPDKDTSPAQENQVPVPHNDVLPEPGPAGIQFATMKGKLRLPARGDIVHRFGSPRAEGGMNWRGMLIQAEAGTEVRAVAAGQVVYADWLRGFGNLMIIDHGGGYLTLYGYNESLLKRVGDQVHAGDTIARTGNSGGGGETGLYFELRYLGKPVDPGPWTRTAS